MEKSTKKKVKILGIVIILLAILLFVVRAASPKEIDDVSPGIYCEPEYLAKADILWVIPNYNTSDISKNKEWCNQISSLNKETQMHGVKHQPYKEFKVDNRSENYFQEGIDIFEVCFNEKPSKFKSPQLALSRENKKMIRENFPEIKIKDWFNQLTHKVYHCSDTGLVKNKYTDIF